MGGLTTQSRPYTHWAQSELRHRVETPPTEAERRATEREAGGKRIRPNPVADPPEHVAGFATVVL